MSRRCWSRPFLCGFLGTVLLWVCLPIAPLTAAEYEKAGEVESSDYLPSESLTGPGWNVAKVAVNDGAFNNYSVESRFGTFEARGRTMVTIRGREVEALEELDKTSKSEVFMNAARDSATSSVKSVVDFASHPVDTLTSTPSAVGRWFKKTKYQVTEGYVDAKGAVAKDADGEEEAAEGSGESSSTDKVEQVARTEAKSYLGLTAAERRWYAELGVDPYTDNQVLRKVIKSYSQIEGITKFGMRFVGIPSIPGAREVGKVMNLVWETDPWELKLMNRKILLAAGISEEVARAFEDSPHLSLTQQTGIAQAVEALEGVKGRHYLVEDALGVESHGEGSEVLQSNLLLVRHHRHSRPLAEVLPGVRAPVARSQDGRLLTVTMADAPFWTEEVAKGVHSFAKMYEDDPAETRELWVVGEASERFRSEVTALGWQIFDDWQVEPQDGSAAPGVGDSKK